MIDEEYVSDGLSFKQEWVEYKEGMYKKVPGLFKSEKQEIYHIYSINNKKHLSINISKIECWEEAYSKLQQLLKFGCSSGAKIEMSNNLEYWEDYTA